MNHENEEIQETQKHTYKRYKFANFLLQIICWISCQDLSQRCWLVAPTNRRSGRFTNARHAGDRGWKLKDLLPALVGQCFWAPDGCEVPLFLSTTSISASPCFFLCVVKPPVILAELVQLDSSDIRDVPLSFKILLVKYQATLLAGDTWSVFLVRQGTYLFGSGLLHLSLGLLGLLTVDVSVSFEEAGWYWLQL